MEPNKDLTDLVKKSEDLAIEWFGKKSRWSFHDG